MKQAYIVIDIGTGNSRVAVVSAAGEILTIEKENTVLHKDARVPNAEYFDPNQWRTCIFDLIRRVMRKTEKVEIIGVTSVTLRQGIVLIGQDGSSLVGYSNGDRRGQAYMEGRDWDRVMQLTGLSPSAIFSAVKVMGAMRLDPELIEKTKYYTSISDWIGYLFTGKCVWEKAQAMQSCLYDIQREAWSQELCDILGLNIALLPELAEAGTLLGNVTEDIRRELGWTGEVPYIVGTADTQAALEAMQPELGDVVIVSGTTSPCLKVKNRFTPYPMTWVSPTTQPGRLMLEVNTASCGINVQRFKNLMMPDVSYDVLAEDALCRGIPEKSLPGVIAVFSPGLHLDKMTPDGGFVLRSPIAVDLKAYDFFHAMVLNTALSIVMCLERMKTLDGIEKPYLIGCGGGFESPVTGQAVADLIGLPVRIYENYREAAVFGGYALCCRATGMRIPAWKVLRVLEPHNCEMLEAYYQQWKQARKCFQGLSFEP